MIDAAGYDRLAIKGEIAVRVASDVPFAGWLRENPGALGAGFVIIELHNYVFRGPIANRAAELVANNAIHAGGVLPPEETGPGKMVDVRQGNAGLLGGS